MKKITLTMMACCIALALFAQRPAADKIESTKGSITLQPIKHGSVVVLWDNHVVYVDPDGGKEAFQGLAAPELVLITDIHGDHFSTKTLDALDLSKARLIVPQAVADQLSPALKSKAIVVANGKSTDQLGIHISAIPMYNLPEAPDSKHTKGRGNGYVLGMGGKQVYFSGDTEDIPEMRALKNIDVAFVCMNLPYTMDIKQAAEGVLAFKPKVVYPYHYRGQDGLADTEGFKKLVNDKDKSIDVRLRNWYGN